MYVCVRLLDTQELELQKVMSCVCAGTCVLWKSSHNSEPWSRLFGPKNDYVKTENTADVVQTLVRNTKERKAGRPSSSPAWAT